MTKAGLLLFDKDGAVNFDASTRLCRFIDCFAMYPGQIPVSFYGADLLRYYRDQDKVKRRCEEESQKLYGLPYDSLVGPMWWKITQQIVDELMKSDVIPWGEKGGGCIDFKNQLLPGEKLFASSSGPNFTFKIEGTAIRYYFDNIITFSWEMPMYHFLDEHDKANIYGYLRVGAY
ncbi:hypothetical protein C3L56_00705 [Veillonellaceae bacterium M2-4]|nr:hypothetical protein [Veillonellaceae bacterium M2-4]